MEHIPLKIKTQKTVTPQPADDWGTPDHCTCGKHYYEEHTCPYAVEINDDHETLCTCCPHCEAQCAWDV